jgi:hypothetical protein
MNQEETMIKQVARERKRALTQALWNVLTDLDSEDRGLLARVPRGADR